MKILTTLIIPAFICGILFNFTFSVATISNFINSEWIKIKNRFIDTILHLGGYWFLTSLAFIELIYLSIGLLPKRLKISCIIILLCLIFPIISKGIILPYSFHATIVGFGFFLLGRFVKNNENKLSRIPFFLLQISFLLYLIFVLYLTIHNKAWVDVHLNQYTPLFSTCLLSTLGAVITFLLFSRLNIRNCVLQYIGQNTLLLYMINGFVFQFFFLFVKVNINKTLYGLFATIFGLSLGLCICFFINKYTPWLIGKNNMAIKKLREL